MSPTPLITSGLDRVRNFILNLDEPAARAAVGLESSCYSWDLAFTATESVLLGELTVEATEEFGQWSEGRGTREEWKKLAEPVTMYFSGVG